MQVNYIEEEIIAETSQIIALCHIIDDFEEFQKRLMTMLTSKTNHHFLTQIDDISHGKFRIGAQKVKQFYSENKTVIDTINHYSTIVRFIHYNYSRSGVPFKGLQFFYEYIFHHKDKIEQILEVLVKLKKLGFNNLVFNEDLDFTKEEYTASTIFNSRIKYMDNVQVIPSYDPNTIHYRTTYSNYQMDLVLFRDRISQSCSEIILNSLLFDARSIPENLTKETIFEPMLKLKKEQEDQTRSIRNTIGLNLCISNLEKVLDSTNSAINGFEELNNKEEFRTVLLSIRKNIEDLKTLSEKYESSVSENEPLLTPEILENEKTLYLKRMKMGSYDD